MKRFVIIAVLLASLSSFVQAAVTVKDPWVRATTSFQKSTVAFMQITSSSDARLVKADSPVAKMVEIHKMVMKGYTMKMQAVSSIDLPAGKLIELKPDGYMVMLTGLKQQIKEGDTIPFSIVIEGKDKKLETIKVDASAINMETAASHKDTLAHMQDHDNMDEEVHGHMR